MSGGYFNYAQSHIREIADEIQHLIETNLSTEKNEYGETIGRHFPPKVIRKFREAVIVLRRAAIYAQRVDWLVSCDDGPENFLQRLQEELDDEEEGVL